MATRDMSIRSVIVVVFVALMAITTASVGFIVFSNWFSSARSVSEKLALDMNEDIFGKIDSHLATPLSMNEVHRAAIESGVVDLDDAAERERFFTGVLRAQPEFVYSFSYGSEAGEYYGARRNASGLKMLGYARESDLIGRNMHDAIHHSRPDGTPVSSQECRIFRAFASGEGIHVDGEVFRRADGTCFYVEYFSYPQFRDGEIVGAVVTFLDDTDRRENEERIGYLSLHDVLTGLSNRMFFESELRRIDVPENLPVSIVFGDVNGLKLTNDIFGHAAGDELLRKAAGILRRVCRESDVISRVGGDEFAILLAKTEPEEAARIVERIGREFAKETIVAIRASVSVGFDTKTEARQSIEETLRNAEDAMYRTKTLDRKAVASGMIDTIVETFHSENPWEKRHALLVSGLCREIGTAMGMPETEIRKLRETGLLHDIGKIALTGGTAHVRTPRTKEEIEAFQQHPVVGFRILNLFDDTLDLAEGVLNHHENWDGSGYPRGISGVEIPLASRIVRIAESFVSMTEEDGGHVLAPQEALDRIRKGAGTIFDPEIVEVFVRLVSARTSGTVASDA